MLGNDYDFGERVIASAKDAGESMWPLPIAEEMKALVTSSKIADLRQHNPKRYGATMITSRGCPYTCSFCDRTVFERLYKTNSAQYTYDHMKYLRDNFGVYHINMYDDLFTAKKQRVMDLCDLLIENPLGVQWNCAIRTGHTSDEMLAKLKQAGVLMVSMGIESADPHPEASLVHPAARAPRRR